MRRPAVLLALAGLAVAVAGRAAAESTVYEVTSPYHHIRVADDGDMRTLYFDDFPQSRMSLREPARGHFAYVDYLHLPWLWNDGIRNVLMVGLGGGSVVRAYRTAHPQARIDVAELDPKVVEVASTWFGVRHGQGVRIFTEDGRILLERSAQSYDLLVLDAYTQSRYGTGIPYTLVTREFFALAASRLGVNGVLAYNVIGSVGAGRDSVLSRIYRTLEDCFPRIYLYPVAGTGNVVVLATASPVLLSPAELGERARRLAESGTPTPTGLQELAASMWPDPPLGAAASRALTDAIAPASGLLETRITGGWIPRRSIGRAGEGRTAP